MSFASIYFIFIFLPVVCLLYYLLPKGNWRNVLLVLASLAFFAWVEFENLHLLLLFILVNYLVGLLIDFFQFREQPAGSRWVMWAALVLNLGFLGFYKYLGLFDQLLPWLASMEIAFEKPPLILGLSYLTFSSLSYILDIYHGVKAPEKNILKFSAYLVMFPKLIQGPIALYKDLAPQLNSPTAKLDDIAWGIRRFIFGLAKKVILADNLAIVANRVFSKDPNRLGADLAWLGLIAYTLVIYFDFAGYTDMALGIGRILGFRLPDNFDDPYTSRNITEFWRRWHMSLTTWFRTYVFFPLEFKRRRSKFLRQQTNIMIVFLLTGLWHGASWNFVIWGGYYGLILALEASGFAKVIKRTPLFFQHLYTLIIVMVGWVFFRVTNLQNWGPFFGALVGRNGISHLETLCSLNILFYIPLILLGIVLCFPLREKFEKAYATRSVVKNTLVDVIVFGVFLLSVAFILSNGFQMFMYAQF